MSHLDDIFQTLLNARDSQSLPPVDKWHPQHEGSIDIRIDQQGRWFHEGGEIKRAGLVKVFSSVLRKEGAGYFLVTPAEKLAIQVADVPFVAINFECRGSDKATDLLFTTNVDDHVLIDAQHPLTMRDGVPYIEVRSGLQARVNRSTFYRLVELSHDEQGEVAVYSQAQRFVLGASG